MKIVGWVLLVSGAALLGWAGTNHTHTSYYCQKCGMRAVRDQREWGGVRFQDSLSPSDTRYSKIYKQVVSPTCQHQWVFTGSRSSGTLLRVGEIGDGAFPYALRFDGYYPRLQVLSPTRAAAVLKALPLRPVVNVKRQSKIMDALDELDGDSQPQSQKWWNKNKELFPKEEKPKVN